jgi:heavy metal sensor kinase
LSLFFLGALALVLVGFSVTLYLLARTHLYRQSDERLEAALDTLVAAVEIETDGLEWEPNQRRLTLGQDAGDDQVRWVLRDRQGQVKDRSANLAGGDPLSGSWPDVTLGQTDTVLWADGQPWHLVQRCVSYDGPVVVSEKAKLLVLTGALSQASVRATLGRLALALAGLSGGLWVAAAVLGRGLCRRALDPLTRMAAAARAMKATGMEQRLPAPATGDELQELGLAFNDLLTRQQEAFERQRRFTGDASHQLRTPLTALLGQIEVALRRPRPADEYRQTLSLVHGQAVQLRQIVEMLLFLARADAEAKLPHLETVDLAAWLDEYLARRSGDPRSADVRVEPSSPGPLSVRVQPALLGQLLDNLLENAGKYSPAGRPIRLGLGRDSSGVTCIVEDEGCGIAAEDLPHVFEPFFRSARARRLGYSGVGLGLAVVQRIASAFGGTVQVQSELGRGSRFTLHLPPAQVPGPPTDAMTPTEASVG